MALKPTAYVVPAVLAGLAWLATRKATAGVVLTTPPGSTPGAVPAPSQTPPAGGSGSAVVRQLQPPRATRQAVVRHRLGDPLTDRRVPAPSSERRVPRPEVAKYQQELDVLGYARYLGERTDRGTVVPLDLETDGEWSLLWANALLRFQEDAGLYPDGGAKPGELDDLTTDAIDWAYHDHIGAGA